MNKEASLRFITNMLKSKTGKRVASTIVGSSAIKMPKLTKTKKLTSKAKRLLGEKPAKSIFKEPLHYSHPRTGKAARIARESQYIEKPEGLGIAGFLLPKKMKTKYNRFMRHLDERLGQAVTKKGKKKGLFIESEMIKDPSNPRKYLKHTYPSISSPIKKTSKFATPVLASMYVMDKLDKGNKPKNINYNMQKMSHAREDTMSDNDKVLVPKSELEKTAAALKQIKVIKEKSEEREKQAGEIEKKAQLEKRAQKVAFLMVEKGTSPSFKSYEEFQEKVASLMEENLEVVEKALEYNTQSLASICDLGEKVGKGNNALEQFVLED